MILNEMNMDYQKELKDLILATVKEGASDLHITVGKYPTLRVSGSLVPLLSKPIVSFQNAEGIVFAMLSEEQKDIFLKTKELDFSYNFEEKARFRVNAYYQKGYVAASLRFIPVEIRTLEELNLPPVLKEFAMKEQGFFLVVGPTGHGKSTTLASLVDIINHEQTKHIVTIEDPVEYLFTADQCIISQREVGQDTLSFKKGLRSMFREDVDVLMVGEMRDPDTMSTAVTAAETGHLVLSSLHTNSASQTIFRIIDSFPAAQQEQIRAQLSGSLVGIFSQRLVPRASGGLIPAYEILVANTAVANLIRENRIYEIDIVIETSREFGMVSLNQTLADMVRRGEVAMENAMKYSYNPKSLKDLMS